MADDLREPSVAVVAVLQMIDEIDLRALAILVAPLLRQRVPRAAVEARTSGGESTSLRAIRERSGRAWLRCLRSRERLTRCISASTSASSASGRSRYFAHSCGMCAMSSSDARVDRVDGRRHAVLAAGGRDRAVEHVDLGLRLRRRARSSSSDGGLRSARAGDAARQQPARERARQRRDAEERAHRIARQDRSAKISSPSSPRALRESCGSRA